MDTKASDTKFTPILEKLQSDGKISAYPLGYCEPGYTCGPKGVLLANWNDIDKDLQQWLEDTGYSLDWSDEWDECLTCGKLFRNTGDSYGWKKYGAVVNDELTCGDCLKKDPKDYFKSLEGSHRNAVTIEGLAPKDHGYMKINGDSYENGWHPGQDDDPRTIAATLRSRGCTRFIFDVTCVGQFDLAFDLYVHESQKDIIPAIKEALAKD